MIKLVADPVLLYWSVRAVMVSLSIKLLILCANLTFNERILSMKSVLTSKFKNFNQLLINWVYPILDTNSPAELFSPCTSNCAGSANCQVFKVCLFSSRRLLASGLTQLIGSPNTVANLPGLDNNNASVIA